MNILKWLAVLCVLGAALVMPMPGSAVVSRRTLAQECPTIVTARRLANVWPSPSLRHRTPLAVMQRGDVAYLIARDRGNNWYRVFFEGQDGWVQAQSVVASCLPAPAPTATPVPTSASFRATPARIRPGDCAMLTWRAGEASGVNFVEGDAITDVRGATARVVCPLVSTAYLLHVQRPDGTAYHEVAMVQVVPPPTAAPPTPTLSVPAFNLRADAPSIALGQCTTLRWNVGGVQAVYLWDGVVRQGVGGNDSRQVCPAVTTTYRLEVVANDNQVLQDALTVVVTGDARPANIDLFAVDPNSILRGQCSTLRWQVSGPTRSVQLFDGQSLFALAPSGEVGLCPQVSTVYSLRVTALDGTPLERSLVVGVLVPTATPGLPTPIP